MRFTEQIGRWRVRFVVHPTRRAFARRCRVADRTTGLYAPSSAAARHRYLLGTVHLPRSADPGTVAHEALHVILDWFKVRGFTATQAMDNEERAASYIAALVRRYYYELGRGDA